MTGLFYLDFRLHHGGGDARAFETQKLLPKVFVDIGLSVPWTVEVFHLHEKRFGSDRPLGRAAGAPRGCRVLRHDFSFSENLCLDIRERSLLIRRASCRCGPARR